MIIPPEDQELNKLVDKTSEMLYIQIVERIRMWIIKGYLKEGDTLPSERELAQMFDVSRMPVSQALKILEFLGVVQYVRGKGVCIKKINLQHILNNIGFLVLDPQEGLHDLFEVRMAIEIQAAKLAAQRRTQEDLDVIEDTLLEMERNIIMKKEVKDASVRFHSTIIAASGNDVLIKVNDFLMELLRHSAGEVLKEVNRQDVALISHKQIFQAIKKQNSDLARSLMQEHLQEMSALIDTK